MSAKVDFNPKLLRRDKEGEYIRIKGTIYQENTTILNMHVPNVSASNLVKIHDWT
jgi:hypothetical protein